MTTMNVQKKRMGSVDLEEEDDDDYVDDKLDDF
jgi:hypothetical protein